MSNVTALTVYTACFGGYDVIRPLRAEGATGSAAEFIMFTDQEHVDAAGWHVVTVPADIGDDPRRAARLFKTLPHRIMPAADVWIWHDANVQLLVTPEALVESWLGDGDLAVPRHPSRNCAYDEANACRRKHKGDPNVIVAQMKAYEAEGFPRFAGLAETRVVIRRNTETVALFNEIWWSQIEQYSERDQLSFNYALWKSSLKWTQIDAWVPGHPWFVHRMHGR